MNRRFLMVTAILTLVFGIFSGCGREERQQEELLLLPIQEDLEVPAADVLKEGEVSEAGSDLEENTKGTCVVHICGAVAAPGVYILEEGSRVYQVIEQAGGFCEDAEEAYLNQAELLVDGMKLYVPTKEEAAQAGASGNWQNTISAAALETKESLVNINTADEELLCTLPGVGSSKAKSIIAYREKNGDFQTIEDIMNVEGIKDGLFQKIKDSITV